jgi:integrase/recombinase XerD
VCEREGVDPVTADRAHVAVFVRVLTSRPHHRGANVVAIDSGAGLTNATIQQRLVPVRLFYDFLMEEGLRESNPVGRAIHPRRPRWRSAARPGAALDRLLDRLADIPTPAGPTPRQLDPRAAPPSSRSSMSVKLRQGRSDNSDSTE